MSEFQTAVAKPGTMPKLLLTVPEAAYALGISRSKVYMLIMQERLFSVKVGASRRVPVKALEDYIAQLIALENLEKAG